MTRFLWPDPKALLDELAERMAEGGAAMQVAAPERIAAGIERARTAEGYDPDLDAAALAALIFEATATQHVLVDGNKRFAWLSAVVFLDLNRPWFDAPEWDAFEMALGVVTKARTAEEMAVFIRAHLREA